MELPAGTPLNPLVHSPIVSVTGKASETRDWSSLPGDLLILIAGRLTSLADFYSFRQVCSRWHSNVVPSADTLASQPPLIMLHVENRETVMSEKEDGKDKQPSRLSSFDVVFLDVMKGRFYKSESSSCWRSFQLLNFSHGYLAKALGSGHILLCHFFTNDKICLPRTRKPFSNKRIIFSENPSSPQCLFALYNYHDSTVEFCQQGDSSWKTVNLDDYCGVMDMVFFQGKIYALLYTEFRYNVFQLAVIEFNPSFALKLLGVPMKFQRPYIFTCGDELLLCCPWEVLVWDFGHSMWILKSSIDGRAIFFSSHQVTAFTKPTLDSWVKPNYKYYYDKYGHSLEYSAIDPGDDDYSEQSFVYPESEGIQSWCVGRPVWIFPSMCFPVKV